MLQTMVSNRDQQIYNCFFFYLFRSWDPITQKHKGFAFVEYEVPEAAQLALEQMNGVIISGRNIKVGRPSNMPQAQQVIDDITLEAKNYNRIYVASIHADLSQDDIKSVFEAFGPIQTCDLAMTSVPNRHKGYCFIEYATSQAATDAISSMNLFDLGGQYLRVGRSITPPDTKNQGPPSAIPQIMPTAAAVAAAAATAKIQAMDAVATNLGLKVSDIMNSSTDTRPITVNSSTMSSMSSFSQPSEAVIPPPPPPTTVVVQPPQPPPVLQQPISSARSTSGGFSSIPPPGIVSFAPSNAPPLPPPTTRFDEAPSYAPLPPQPPIKTEPDMGPPIAPMPPSSTPAEMLAKIEDAAHKKQQEELQKKLMEGQEPATLQQQENMSIKGQSARHLVMQKLMRTQAQSGVIVLRNMVGPENIDEELEDEINEECSNFGEVERVIIYQERQSEEDDADVLVKIFVEFKDPNSAKNAKNALNGRYFAGRKVICDIYDQDLFHHSDLSG